MVCEKQVEAAVLARGGATEGPPRGVSRDTVILRLGPRASRGIRPPPVYIALRFKPATLTALWGRGVRIPAWGCAAVPG